MKRIHILFFALLWNSILILSSTLLSAQSCLPEGVTFTEQFQIDQFKVKYPTCKMVSGDVIIDGAAITNLAGLSQIGTIGGDLVIRDNSALPNLNGLNGLSSIGGKLFITNNDKLQDLTGLEGLTSIGTNLSILSNPKINSFSGLENLSSIGGYLNLANNDVLNNCTGLDNLASIGGYIKISGNDGLTSLTGIQNIDPTSIQSTDANEDLEIVNNLQLSDCEIQSVCHFLALPGITVNIRNNAAGCDSEKEACGPICPPGDLVFTTQQEINEFGRYYPNCNQIPGNVTITGTPNPDIIHNLEGLSQITSIKGNLVINQGMHSGRDRTLSDLSGFENLTSVEGKLTISNNEDLVNLTGLENLETVGGGLSISNNRLLTSLRGLENLETVGGDLGIVANPLLTDLYSLEQLISIQGNLSIKNNNNLISLEGIQNLDPEFIKSNTSDEDLIITNNPKLSICEVSSICQLLTLPGTITSIAGNATNCNSKTEIETACSNLDCPLNNLFFKSQQEIDDFKNNYPSCTLVNGDLVISGNDITNLTGLEQITSISGNLNIENNENLTTLNGLENLVAIKGYLSIINNKNLVKLDGIQNIDPTTIKTKGAISGTGIGEYDLTITDNPKLSECNVESICNFLMLEFTSFNIRHNKTGCNTSSDLKSACPSCPGGDVILTNQIQVNDFINQYPGCTFIPGNLTIKGSTINNLAGLNEISIVRGNLTITDNIALASLEGLSNLSNVKGSLQINNNDKLTDLKGMHGLTSIRGFLSISENPKLESLNGLTNLISIGGGRISIQGNNELTSLTGLQNINPLSIYSSDENEALIIANNPKLSECAVESICQLLAVSWKTTLILNNAEGCNIREEIASNCLGKFCPRNLSFNNQNQIDSFAILYPGCTELEGSIGIHGNDITNLFGLSQINYIEHLYIRNNEVLTNLRGLEGLESVGSLNIENNHVLTSLDWLDNINYLGKLRIIRNENLINLNGLNQLSSIEGKVSIYNNDALITLEGLENVNSIDGEVSIYNNDALITLKGLENVNSIDGALSIQFNDALTSLDGIQNINPFTIQSYGAIEDLTIVGNTKLSGCSVTSICQLLVLPGTSTNISQNLDGCNTVAEIQSECPDCPKGGDVILSKQSQIDNFPLNHSGCTEVTGNLVIDGLGITNLAGLLQINSVGGYLYITNTVLTNLKGLDNINSINGFLYIGKNDSLANLIGLDNLLTMGGHIKIEENISLSSLEGIQNIYSSTIQSVDRRNEDLEIINNPKLSDCATKAVCLFLVKNGITTNIQGNALGCNTTAEIRDNCSFLICPKGNLIFQSQQEIDDFGLLYPNCSEIAGNMVVIGNDITNLYGLSNIVTINGDLTIDNTKLVNFKGFDKLTFIDGNLEIVNNYQLLNFDGLTNLSRIYGYFKVSSNETLENFYGLYNLGLIRGDFYILKNSSLINFNGLERLNMIVGSLYIVNNDALINLNGLENLRSVKDKIGIKDNDVLTNLDGIRNLELQSERSKNTDNSITISNNPLLSKCNIEYICKLMAISGIYSEIRDNGSGCNAHVNWELACAGNNCPENDLDFGTQQEIDDFSELYPNCTEISGNVTVKGNTITNLAGLSQITAIGGYLNITNNVALTGLIDLANLTQIGGNFRINDNDALTNLNGLENLTGIGGHLDILENETLINLNGIQNIDPATIQSIDTNEDLTITNNPQLSECAVKSVCQFLAIPGVTTKVQNNGSGCNTRSQIKTTCGIVSAVNLFQDKNIQLYPNPTTGQIHITGIEEGQVKVTDIVGRVFIEKKLSEPTIDISTIPDGLYFIQIVAEKKWIYIGKVIKKEVW